jgi:hypothetical protein
MQFPAGAAFSCSAGPTGLGFPGTSAKIPNLYLPTHFEVSFVRKIRVPPDGTLAAS